MKVKLYPYYSHRVDPIMGRLCSIIKRNGDGNKVAAAKANCSVSTLNNWEKKKIQRPKFTTVAGVARSLGDEGIQAVIDTIKKGK